MLELAEIRLTSDYINKVSEGVIFNQVRKNPISKNMDLGYTSTRFTINAETRGKELKINFTDLIEGGTKSLIVTAGMSGKFRITSYGIDLPHWMFALDGNMGRPNAVTLSFIDVRRFGKWHWGDWNVTRSPDPTIEYEQFVEHIKNNLTKRKFKKPIFDLLMDQEYFNGIGNYLRSVILHRANINPFLPASVVIKNHPQILELCRQIPLEAYTMGGGELKDWENPFTEKKGKKKGWDKWVYPYQKGAYIIGEGGRRFWFDKRWDPRTIKLEERKLL